MNTPVFDFINQYGKSNNIRFHVPGHKGKDRGLSEPSDITEIEKADVLYHETGILKESQENASSLFGTGMTLYSTEGSSLCIRGMLALIRMYAAFSGRKPVVAAGRNAHKVFMTASALLGLDVKWLMPRNEAPLVSCNISSLYLDEFLVGCAEKPVAVYITSPDYLGNMADISALSQVCRKHGCLLVVDNAHGAYLNFLPDNIHPIHLGADMCCDSAHKTLPVLTGGAYLHISENADVFLRENARKAISLFASTSPSYLILLSLDRANALINDEYRQSLKALTEKVSLLKTQLMSNGMTFVGDEPLKITFSTKAFGYSGGEVAEILRKNGIECEFSDPDYVVLMLTPDNTWEEINLLTEVLLLLPKKAPIVEACPVIKPLEQKLSVREALFAPSRSIDTSDGAGKILADACVTCPPAVPIAVCGERLDDEAVAVFRYYGIEKINVVDIEVE